VKFFKITRAYRNVVLKESDHTSSYANAITLQSKTQNQLAQRDEAQKSKNNNPANKRDKLSKKRARKCVYEEIHEFEECSYIFSSTRTSD
jgi:hypothetical protein